MEAERAPAKGASEPPRIASKAVLPPSKFTEHGYDYLRAPGWRSRMCRASVIEFFLESVHLKDFHGKRVLEVGSRSVNGSVRPIVTRLGEPAEYIGVDVSSGKFVDQLVAVDRLIVHFGPSSFDAVVSTEMLEHIQNWRTAVTNLKGVLRQGGAIYLTTRSLGFPFHGYPFDFWRYEVEDMRRIFSDFEIVSLIPDSHTQVFS